MLLAGHRPHHNGWSEARHTSWRLDPPVGCSRAFGPPSGPKDRYPGDAFRCSVFPATALGTVLGRTIWTTGVPVEEHEASTSTLLQGSQLTQKGRADVFRQRERTKRKKILRAIVFVVLIDAYLFHRVITDNPFQLPKLGSDWIIFLPAVLLIFAVVLMVAMPLMNGRSPHVTIHPEQVEVGLTDDQRSRRPGRGGRPDPRRVPGLRDLPRRAGRHPTARHPVRRAAGHRQDVPGQGHGEAGGRAVPVRLRARVPVDVSTG